MRHGYKLIAARVGALCGIREFRIYWFLSRSSVEVSSWVCSRIQSLVLQLRARFSWIAKRRFAVFYVWGQSVTALPRDWSGGSGRLFREEIREEILPWNWWEKRCSSYAGDMILFSPHGLFLLDLVHVRVLVFIHVSACMLVTEWLTVLLSRREKGMIWPEALWELGIGYNKVVKLWDRIHAAGI